MLAPGAACSSAHGSHKSDFFFLISGKFWSEYQIPARSGRNSNHSFKKKIERNFANKIILKLILITIQTYKQKL